jgi:4-hydroxybenzoate polyprenyltransferase
VINALKFTAIFFSLSGVALAFAIAFQPELFPSVKLPNIWLAVSCMFAGLFLAAAYDRRKRAIK